MKNLKHLIVFENYKLNESQCYYCDDCGERLEHEEYEENPNQRCSNCGGHNWVSEYEMDAREEDDY